MARTISAHIQISKKHILAMVVIFALIGGTYLLSSYADNPNLDGDINNDNIVNVTDLSILLSNYGSITANNSADLNNDGRVDITDLSILLSNYNKTYTPPSDPSWSYTIQPPVAPITNITNLSGLGVNVTSTRNISDVVIDGTGDTGVLFNLGTGGSTLKRVQMKNVAGGNSVSYGKHGIYGKSPRLILEDIDIACSAYCASAVSLRFDGAELRRFKVSGAPHAVTYFETSTTPGTVTIENGSGTFTADTAIWMDAETDYTQKVIQRFVIRNVSFTGNGAFMKVAGTRFASPSVTVEHCFINGRPVTSADLPGVPNVTILP